MKALENIDLKKDDDLYNFIFAEGSSEDDDFEISNNNSLNEDSFDSDFYQIESISEFDEGDNNLYKKNGKKGNSETKIIGVNKNLKKKNNNHKLKYQESKQIENKIQHNYNEIIKIHNSSNENDLHNNNSKSEELQLIQKEKLNSKKRKSLGKSNINILLKEPDPLPNEEIILLGLKRNRRKIPEEELMELDLLDIDKIDEMENMDEEEIESSENEIQDISENSEEFVPNLSKIIKTNLQQNYEFEKNSESTWNNDNSIRNRQPSYSTENLKISNDEFKDYKNLKKNLNNLNEIKENFGSDDVDKEDSLKEKKNLYRFKRKPKEKKSRYRKNFIDYDEDDEYLRKKKKLKENLNGSKKLMKNKQEFGSIGKEINTETEKFHHTNEYSKSILSVQESIHNKTYNLYNPNLNSYVIKSDIKNIQESSDSKSDVKKINNNVKNESNDIVISNFNVILKKRILEPIDNSIFILDKPNREIIYSDYNKIILPKTILLFNMTKIENYMNDCQINHHSITDQYKKITSHKQNPLNKIKNINKTHNLSEKYLSDSNKANVDTVIEKSSQPEKYSIFDSQIESEIAEYQNANDENFKFDFDDLENSENDLMKYNDKNFQRKQRCMEEDFIIGGQIKKTIQKQQAPLKLSYPEKLSQKDLLYEAIFTELYNIKSLEDMQKLEELNKRDLNYSYKKQFSEFIKIKRKLFNNDRVKVKNNEKENKKVPLLKEDRFEDNKNNEYTDSHLKRDIQKQKETFSSISGKNYLD